MKIFFPFFFLLFFFTFDGQHFTTDCNIDVFCLNARYLCFYGNFFFPSVMSTDGNQRSSLRRSPGAQKSRPKKRLTRSSKSRRDWTRSFCSRFFQGINSNIFCPPLYRLFFSAAPIKKSAFFSGNFTIVYCIRRAKYVTNRNHVFIGYLAEDTRTLSSEDRRKYI
jgi:hypothetical protein